MKGGCVRWMYSKYLMYMIWICVRWLYGVHLLEGVEKINVRSTTLVDFLVKVQNTIGKKPLEFIQESSRNPLDDHVSFVYEYRMLFCNQIWSTCT